MSIYRVSFDRDTRIRFTEKPSLEIRSLLKGAGFRWSPSEGFWWRRGVKGGADFCAALDRRLNPGPVGQCWECKSPRGYFRTQGAATPVLCDECHARHQAAARADYVPDVDTMCEDDCARRVGL
jgi:hypothetical protein